MLLPILAVVVLLGLRGWSRRHKVYCALALGLVLAVTAAGIWNFSSRMHLIKTDIQGYATSADRDTSFGIRLQLWHASLLMFEKSPIVGIGPNNFGGELAQLEKQGGRRGGRRRFWRAPQRPARGPLGYGLLGLASILALYLVPAAIFPAPAGERRPRHTGRRADWPVVLPGATAHSA